MVDSKTTTTRREVLKTIGLASAAAAVPVAALAKDELAAPVILSGKREWRMVMTWPKALPGLGTGAVRLAERITRLSEGKLTVHPFGAGELVPALSSFDAVASGTAEMCHSSAYYWLAKNRAAAFFCAVPGGLTTQEQNSWIYFDEGLKLWHELYAEFGLIAFPAGNTGTQMGGWFKKPLHSVDDLQGLKIRMPGLAGEVMALLGANPQNIPGPEIFAALQSGVIDATEWVGPWNDMSLGFHKVAKYYYGPAFQEGGPMLELMINRKAYLDLPEDLQQIVKVAAATENTLMFAEFYANNLRAFEELKKDSSVSILPYPKELLKKFFATAEEVVAGTAEGGDINRRIFESYRAFRTRAMTYGPVQEEGFMAGRRLVTL